jgi:16S rRNA (uracil1498-N3)-methyltransferase
MSKNRLPLSPLRRGELPLPDASAHYLTHVLRLRVGDRFEAFDPREGSVARGDIVSIDDEIVVVHLEAPHASEPPSAPVVLIQGYPKGDKLADIVRDATELGVTIVIPAVCARSVARPDPSKAALRGQRLEAVAAEAARQCGRTRAPTVLAPIPWADALGTASALGTRGFVLFERATVPLRDDLLSLDQDEPVAFAIGPEGGLTDEEVALAEREGFAARSIGTTILRTETAATAVLGAWRIHQRTC